MLWKAVLDSSINYSMTTENRCFVNIWGVQVSAKKIEKSGFESPGWLVAILCFFSKKQKY